MDGASWNACVVLDKDDGDARVYVIGPDIDSPKGNKEMSLQEVVRAGVRALLRSLPKEDAEIAARRCAVDVVQQLARAVRLEAEAMEKLRILMQDKIMFERAPGGLVELKHVSKYLDLVLTEPSATTSHPGYHLAMGAKKRLRNVA